MHWQIPFKLPVRFVWTCRRLHVPLTPSLLIVRVDLQQVWYLQLDPTSNSPNHFRLRNRFRASTSRIGTGQISGSYRTPLGLHRVAQKVGAGQPIGTVFEGRQPVGFTWQGRPAAPIAHRILWLEGIEAGFNRGGSVDTFNRYIYVHGLADEPTLGRPASRGCIHLAASDLLPLFHELPVLSLVWITDGLK